MDKLFTLRKWFFCKRRKRLFRENTGTQRQKEIYPGNSVFFTSVVAFFWEHNKIYSSVTHPFDADLTLLMYLYSQPRVNL